MVCQPSMQNHVAHSLCSTSTQTQAYELDRRFNINQVHDKNLIAKDKVEQCLSKCDLTCFGITWVDSRPHPRSKIPWGCGLGTCVSLSTLVAVMHTSRISDGVKEPKPVNIFLEFC